ncbi:hypothetical protein [Thalassotalea euphylliae]|uniref:Uncharacterized protein n=1 Tax=Thalassotalea euphylliae TaxID=1655234 RepID=A0A3E0UDA4_9GAMM|nr:hypothetical protein [Thalassotalea euphylliae]REL34694.1 hypothetical protein DXX92_04605 [Thalassotalea euphylliae]
MQFQYKENKVRSACNAILRYLHVHSYTRIQLEQLLKTTENHADLTQAFHTILYRLSQQLTADAKGTFNELTCIRQIGKLQLNQAVYLPTPEALIGAGYNTQEINHRITGNGYIRRK